MRTAAKIEEAKAARLSSAPKGKVRGPNGRGKHPNSRKGMANLRPYPKGVSGNPSGKPGYDVSAFLCRRAIEENQQEIIQGMGKRLRAGEPYAFSVFADRGYGKVRERVALENPDGGPLRISIKLVK